MHQPIFQPSPTRLTQRLIVYRTVVNNDFGYYKLTTYMFLLIIFIFFAGFSTEKNISTDEKVELTGALRIQKFPDANGKVEKAWILVLDSPINVMEDEFGGPEKNIKKIQLAFLGKNPIENKYINKNVKVRGILFYAVTAHHHTKVLMEVRDKVEENLKE